MQTADVVRELQKAIDLASYAMRESILHNSDPSATLHFAEKLAQSIQRVVEEYRGGTA